MTPTSFDFLKLLLINNRNKLIEFIINYAKLVTPHYPTSKNIAAIKKFHRSSQV